MTPWFEGYERAVHETEQGIRIAYRRGGHPDAPPLLLLHGFPQTHAMWHRVAQHLGSRFHLVLPDLRGYGDSSMPPGAADHANYSKRAVASDLVDLMRALGHEQWMVAGHDRGGRVAHRMALDHPARVRRMAVIDIAPTLAMYEATDMAFARAYYHWFHLIQPAPLPETHLGADPRFHLRWNLGGWGARGLSHIEPQALAEYERCFCRPAAIHAACEDYRASAGIDLELDRASRDAGERVRCDLLVLWGEHGVVHKLFQPLDEWRRACDGEVQGQALAAGHFIPEERPQETADALARFFDRP